MHRAAYSTPPRALLEATTQRVRRWIEKEVVQPMLEPILHPSPWRVRWLAITTLLGHPLFWFAWARWLPQPYENLPVRLLMAAGGIGLMLVPGAATSTPTRGAATAFSLLLWLTLPWFFSWMYFANGGNAVWLTCLGAMFLIYYHLTDWRLATLGSASGLAAGWLAFLAFGPAVAPLGAAHVATNTLLLAFCWLMALALGFSASNVRRAQLNHTLGTMGIMAHELRTPLATMQLIGEALRNEPTAEGDDAAERLQQLAQRLNNVVRNMNRQIDMQITNARLMRLAGNAERICAGDLVRATIANYPWRSARERDAVRVEVREDFPFLGSRELFAQVIDNLVKNALRSLAAASSSSRAGDVVVEVAREGNRGLIVVRDKGVGMDADLRKRIFLPFFSTDRGTGHGLGLAFCQRVVHAAEGSIRVQSAPREGAVFTIALPVHRTMDPKRP